MADYIYISANVTNKTGNTIATYWVKHRPDEDGGNHDDWGYGTDLADQSQSTDSFELKIVTGTTDKWVVSWTDDQQNLRTSDYYFDASISHSQGNVEIIIESEEIEINQYNNDGDDSDPVSRGTSPINWIGSPTNSTN